eukprot:XP_019923857.1 PREDICTED: multidrug and toxin extrusion protein 1-like [Crassostrea gigas]
MWRLCNDVDVGMYRAELIELLKLAWPMSLQYLTIVPQSLVSQSFCGHIGKEEGDGVTLAITIVVAFGIAVLIGLSSAADTLFSQIQGSGNRGELGVALQKAVGIIEFSFNIRYVGTSNTLNRDYKKEKKPIGLNSHLSSI